MAQRGIFFAGKQILIPGAYATYTSRQASPLNVAATNVVALVGLAYGGLPIIPVAVGGADMDYIQAVFRGGDLVNAAELACNPMGRNVENNPNPGATDLILIRASNATPSSLALSNTAGVALGNLVSLGYGSYTNTHQGEVAHQADGSAILTIQDPTLGLRETSPALGNIMTIKYTGNGTASMTIDDAGLHVTVTPASSAPDGSSSFNILFDNPSAQTISQLAAMIQAQLGFSATVFNASSNMTPKFLDRVSGVALSTTPVVVMGTAGAVATWVNANSKLASFAPASPMPLDAPIAALPMANFNGGGGDHDVDSTTMIASFQKAFAALEQQPCYFVVPIIPDGTDSATESAIRDLAVAHVFKMCDVKVKKPRMLYLGHQRGVVQVDAYGRQDVSAISSVTTTLNASPVIYFTPGFTRTVLGTKTNFNSYFLAAGAAGIKSGSAPQRPLTLRRFKAEDIEVRYDQPTQEALIAAGASYLVAKKDGFKLGIGQTTWVQDDDDLKTEPSIIHVGDTINTTVIETMEAKYGGEAYAGPAQQAAFYADLIRILDEAKDLSMIVDGNDPNTGDFIPAYRDVKVAFANKTWQASGTLTIASPGNYLTFAFGIAPAAGGSL